MVGWLCSCWEMYPFHAVLGGVMKVQGICGIPICHSHSNSNRPALLDNQFASE